MLQRFGVLLASSALVASQTGAAPSPQNSARTSLSMREFKRLREHANTPEEFHKLAVWCQLKAEQYRQSKAELEAEVGDHHSRISPQSNPKHPTRGQDLRTLAAHYGELSKQWTDLSGLYSSKAAELEAWTMK